MQPEDDRETLAAVQLNLISGLGPRLQSLLFQRFGSAEAIFNAPGSELLNVAGIGPKVSAEITKHSGLEQARKEIEKAHQHGIRIVPRSSSEYPASLKETSDPPPVLSIRRNLLPEDRLAVAIVGSRSCSHYGRTQAHRFAGALARAGIVVVSGLARGIDAAAHTGALEAGGRTIAVCATGLLKTYPPEHVDLASRIVDQGALVSESPLDRGPQRGLFPQRNRIIAGMSLGVIIIEASEKSGSLHTARHAMEQNREVFAVPGRIDTPASLGCHNLIRDGATLVRNFDDVLESLAPLSSPLKTDHDQEIHTPRELNLNEQERAILNLVDTVATPIDQVLAQSQMPTARVLSTITVLEMKRLVRRLPGSFLERTTG
ncbi:hypothetical protein KOR42_36940 [Thalassoglobus neptunius]|uniref:Uncharacterized protein n=1 Tax=Thalassoglobus neptunius TaxID=1938619 RepID=A0A5C5WH80_9PLAN|nr:DNA-processing protein DprA [Thalassoglobus neptunius]TWT50010.1 hypothetical protein KOR42_36940 [Thalassoglobus neptunius]